MLAGAREGITLQDIDLAMRIAKLLERRDRDASALAYREFSQAVLKSHDQRWDAAAQFMEGQHAA